MMASIIFFIWGSMVGSFLNVCIYRLPLSLSIVSPRSFCPSCKKMIPWYCNIPLLSYIFLRGKCYSCKGPISFRYFIVELLTALMFVTLLNIYGLSLDLLFYGIMVCGLIVATFVDMRHRVIPDAVSIGGMVAGFLLSAVLGIRHFGYNPAPLIDSFLGIIIGGGIIYLTGFLFDLVYFKILKKPAIQGETESMGSGDVMLLAMIGAFLGWKRVLLVFFMAPFFGAAVGIINLVVKKDHTLPYGPFLSLAAIIGLLWGNKILNSIFF